MTEEQKAKMAEGRRRALAEKQAKERIPQPVADLPAGHLRDEQLKVNADHLEQQREIEAKEIGQEAIDPEKFRHIDNEIAQKLTIDDRGVNIEVEDAQAGYHYKWLTVEEADRSGRYGAAQAIRSMREAHRRVGFERVEGNDPEATNFKGKDFCAGTTGRGCGDADLWRIRKDRAQALHEYHMRRLERQQMVEPDYVYLGQTRLGHRNTAVANPQTGARFRDDMTPQTFNVKMNDDALRSGSIKDPRTGRILPPGYERQGR